MTEPQNLPAIVAKQGGELVKVLGWPQHASLSLGQQIQLGAMVLRHPELNTQLAVDLLADAAGYFGEELDRWFQSAVDDAGIETVTLAINTLDALGIHSRGKGGDEQRERDRFSLDDMLNLMELLRQLNRERLTVEGLCKVIDRLGGWEVAIRVDIAQAEGLFDGTLEIERVRHEVCAPKSDDPGDEDDEDM